jgi:hypothetical protein
MQKWGAGQGRREAENNANPMESLWNSYGIPMEFLWSNTRATRQQRAEGAGAGRRGLGESAVVRVCARGADAKNGAGSDRAVKVVP